MNRNQYTILKEETSKDSRMIGIKYNVFKSKIPCFILACSLFLFLLMYYTTYQNNKDSPGNVEVIERVIRIMTKSKKLILLWDQTWLTGDHIIGFTENSFKEKGCPIHDCMIFKDRNEIPTQLYDAIIFHYRRDDKDMPKKATSQKFIYFTLESPKHAPIPDNADDLFDWTMTYRLDSDIPFTYFRIIDFNGNFVAPTYDPKWLRYDNDDNYYNDSLVQLVKKKNKKIAWFVSNCESSVRKTYVEHLTQYIDVDIYGACGKLRCPREKKCFEMLSENYLFYLSFENSYCEDYVTEKIQNALNYDTVPIVLGGANYSNFLPPGSYIDASLFSPKDLASLVNNLSLDFTEYMKYFRWRRHYLFDPEFSHSKHAFCRLCEKLLKHNHDSGFVKHGLVEWWAGDEHNPVCYKPKIQL